MLFGVFGLHKRFMHIFSSNKDKLVFEMCNLLAESICVFVLSPTAECSAELWPLTQHHNSPEKHKVICLLCRLNEIRLNRATNFLLLFVLVHVALPLPAAVDNFVHPSFSNTNEEPSVLHNSLTRKAAKRALWIL